MDPKDCDAVSFDYSIENKGKTHLLVIEFPEPCDEENFLIILKAYVGAQSENLRRIYAGVKHS